MRDIAVPAPAGWPCTPRVRSARPGSDPHVAGQTPERARRGSDRVAAQEAARDDQPLDLVRALADQEERGVAVVGARSGTPSCSRSRRGCASTPRRSAARSRSRRAWPCPPRRRRGRRRPSCAAAAAIRCFAASSRVAMSASLAWISLVLGRSACRRPCAPARSGSRLVGAQRDAQAARADVDAADLDAAHHLVEALTLALGPPRIVEAGTRWSSKAISSVSTPL